MTEHLHSRELPSGLAPALPASETPSATLPSPPAVPSSAKQAPPRLASLDQFRGYTVLGMFVVNFLGSFRITPALLRHHDTYFSYADAIMPHFFFAVGFAYRLTFLRGLAGGSRSSVVGRVCRRNLKLVALGAVMYLAPALVSALASSNPPTLGKFLAQALQEELFQTLVHIAVTALWILPVIGARPIVQALFAAGSAGLHLGLSHWFYYDLVMDTGIDGGMLGFLTWTVPMIAGSLAHDVVAQAGSSRSAIKPLLVWGTGLMLFGYGLSCLNLFTSPNSAGAGVGSWLIEPPFVPPSHPVNVWTMSQRAGSVTYLTFGAGLSLVLYAFFVWACDLRKFQVGVFRTLGSNALAAYVIHIVVGFGFSAFLSRQSPAAAVLPMLLLYLAVCYGAVRYLEWKRLYWRM